MQGTIWGHVESTQDVAFDDLVEVFAIDSAPLVKSDPKGKAKSNGVISVLDIS